MRDCSCGAKPGEVHVDGCYIARCMWTGGQAIRCDGSFADIARQLRSDGHAEMADRLAYYLSFDEDHDCGQDVWSGRGPGKAECEEFGFWCIGPPWRSCSKDTDGATHDLNRLVRECQWNRVTKRWELSAVEAEASKV